MGHYLYPVYIPFSWTFHTNKSEATSLPYLPKHFYIFLFLRVLLVCCRMGGSTWACRVCKMTTSTNEKQEIVEPRFYNISST